MSCDLGGYHYDEHVCDGEIQEKEKESSSSCAASEGHVWVYDPMTAGICVDIYELCYH